MAERCHPGVAAHGPHAEGGAALKGLRCPECLSENLIGAFFCTACAAPLLPFEMIPASERQKLVAATSLGPIGDPFEAAGQAPSRDAAHAVEEEPEDAEPAPSRGRRYRLILGDSCPVCRAASRISFTVDRPPQMPVVGCRDPEGCRCTLPDMVSPAARLPRRVTGHRSDASDTTARAGPLLYDETTDSFSREALEAFATALVSDAMRRGFPLAVILFRVADTSEETSAMLFDGATPMLVLLETIRQTVRAGDIIGRYDACTLAMVAQGAEAAGATQIVECVRAALSARMQADGASMPNLRHGIGVLPTAGTTLAELVEQAGRGLGASSSETTGASRTPSARGNAARGLAPQRDGDQLSVLLAEYESGTIPGIAIVPEPGACPVCADAARDAYSPQSLPPLPLAGCGGLDGCRCHYGRPRKDGRGQPPPLPALQQSPSDIPRALHAAALFGQDPKQGCRVQDLATYLDAFALIPFKAELPLQQGEAAYLLRQGRRGRDDGRLGESLDGMPQFPLRGSLARWVAQASKPPPVPFAAIEFWDPGLLCITNWRIIFGRRGAVESILLSDIKALGYVQGGVCCTVGSRGRRTLFLVADALKIGLCLTRAVRDAVAPVGA